ncbi:secretion protein HlyD (plasmid) [Rhizobium sp. ACO-34A]|nr:HlyD family efflux transporter periplasmic adaptor subunit [Rhizobium sp. ACO-34A]ATN36944.1 secretion protein HlyD [Rhizobium sp. ACO-34A]
MSRFKKIAIPLLFLIVAAGGAGGWYWWQAQQGRLPEGLVSGNGRMEADEVDIAAKTAARVKEVLVQEGDLVDVDQVVARMDTSELNAQRAKYLADVTAEEASMMEAKATVMQRKAELALKEANLARALSLIGSGAISKESRDQAQSERDAAKAVVDAAEKNVVAYQRSVEAAQALVDQVDVQIADAKLTTPVKGRVLYRLANPGEVVSAGGKVLTIINLADVYMEIYLSSEQAMRVAVGSDARIQFDGADFAVPAKVTFVSPEAQFTPKQVETRSERDKLVFRVKLRISSDISEKYIEKAKTGTRGVGYARLDPNPPNWPEFLEKRFPGDTLELRE